MIGVPGTAQRLFGALREHGISVALISQGSSEHSICFALEQAEADRAAAVVREAFDRELRQGQIQRVDVTPRLQHPRRGRRRHGGHARASRPSCSTRSAASGVNVRAIAQGASERNISVVIDAAQTARALGSVHASFYLSPHTISIGLIGPGLVGSAFLDQLASQADRLTRDFRLDLRLRGVLTSTKMLLADTVGADGATGATSLDDGRSAGPAAVRPPRRRRPSPARGDRRLHGQRRRSRGTIPSGSRAGIHVVTPNKQAGSADMAFYRTLGRGAARRRIALPLRGDGRRRAADHPDGARSARDRRSHPGRSRASCRGRCRICSTSGTASSRFPRSCGDAKAQGFTEPDPRDDLSGTDVARKLVILAREMGLDLELARRRARGTRAGVAPVRRRRRSSSHRVPEVDAAMRERFRRGARARQGAAICRPAGCRQPAWRPSAWSNSTGRISSRTSA